MQAIHQTTLQDQLSNMENKNSFLENELRHFEPTLLPIFRATPAVSFETTPTTLGSINDTLLGTFPSTIKAHQNRCLEATTGTPVRGKRVAVLFSGGPAAGGHNVIAGIKRSLGEDNTLFGIKKGPKGLIEGQLFEITQSAIDGVTNLGGFDFLGSDRTKIKTEEQFAAVLNTVRRFKLDGIIVVGGDDSNTNAAFLAEHLFAEGCAVIGVPKTIDGDLQVGQHLPITFGFDTATKIYAELVGNVLQDTPSSVKYWHFVKLMGRSASHVALEVALQCRPTLTLISEEIQEKNTRLGALINHIASVILTRAAKGISHGVVVLPEGLIEFIPEFKTLVGALNHLLAELEVDLKGVSLEEKILMIDDKLPHDLAHLLRSLPVPVRHKLLEDRDSHGNLQVSQIPTELLLIEMVAQKLKELKAHPEKLNSELNLTFTEEEKTLVSKFKFATNTHFFGYEGRCGAPSAFDLSYTFNLGLIAGSLALSGKTGYMAAIGDFKTGGKALALPLTGLITAEKRGTSHAMVIEKALVTLDSPAFRYFESRRDTWAQEDVFSSPGPRQWWGPTASQLPMTVALNQELDSVFFSF
ncbi:MAG: diphosphate--fructose-6-phosphate 1-phosphotransferase [Candidatus Margulisiibacteriota bacterium]